MTDPSYQARYEPIVRATIDSLRLEGIEIDPEWLAVLQAHALGEISAEELLDLAREDPGE